MDCRQRQLDSSLHNEVPPNDANALLTIINHSVERYNPTAWTPPSLPNTIVLLGGGGTVDASFGAEIVPGKEKRLCQEKIRDCAR